MEVITDRQDGRTRNALEQHVAAWRVGRQKEDLTPGDRARRLERANGHRSVAGRDPGDEPFQHLTKRVRRKNADVDRLATIERTGRPGDKLGEAVDGGCLQAVIGRRPLLSDRGPAGPKDRRDPRQRPADSATGRRAPRIRTRSGHASRTRGAGTRPATRRRSRRTTDERSHRFGQVQAAEPALQAEMAASVKIARNGRTGRAGRPTRVLRPRWAADCRSPAPVGVYWVVGPLRPE